jgi:hypothetical protein
MSATETESFDVVKAAEVYGEDGRRIVRVTPVEGHPYIDGRDVKWLMKLDQEQWLIVNFWTQVAIVALLDFYDDGLKYDFLLELI